MYKNIFELIPYFISQKRLKDIYGKYPYEYILDNIHILNNNYIDTKFYDIKFDSILYESLDNIDYTISSIENYDIIQNNSFDIFSTLKNIINNKTYEILDEQYNWLSFESNNYILDEWKNIENNYWHSLVQNIFQQKLYQKNNFRLPIQNGDLLSKIRESILIGYLQYSIKMYNNLVNINISDIEFLIHSFDNKITHHKACFS